MGIYVLIVVVFVALAGIVLAVLRMGGHASVVVHVKEKRKEVRYQGVMTGSELPGGGPAESHDLGGDVTVYLLETDKGELLVNRKTFDCVKNGRRYNMRVRTFRGKIIEIESVLDAVKGN